MKTIYIKTDAHTQMKDTTREVRSIILQSGIKTGLCTIFVPHTTAAVTINENADPDVVRDFKREINKIVPWEDGYHHFEGNSAAHLKASIIGFSETLIIEGGQPVLGTWQGIYFVEFDGPRRRTLHISITG